MNWSSGLRARPGALLGALIALLLAVVATPASAQAVTIQLSVARSSRPRCRWGRQRSPRDLQVTAQGGVPASGVGAVVLMSP